MKVQILLAAHNPAPKLFERQIRSLCDQTEQDWRCLVLDDASEDRAAVLRALDDPRFDVLPATAHLGPYRAFERLLQKADGEVPAFLCDQDDYWHPRKLQRLLEASGTAFSAMRVVDSRGALVRERFLDPPEHLTPAGLLLMNCVSGTSLKVAPEVRAAALPFPAPTLRGWHDQWLAAVAARIGTLTYLDEPLVDYTQHAGQVIGDGLRRLNPRRMRRFLQRPDLRSRSEWVVAAANRLLQLPGPDDPDLEAIAKGHFRELLRRYDVPRQRAVLLTAGRLLTMREDS